MPNNVNSQASKAYQALGKPYTALADVFKEGINNEESNSMLISEAQYGHACWRDDSNEGLVKQVIHAYQRFSVLHLKKAYAALTVAEVTRRTSPDPNNYADTANHLSHLIAMGQLNATISRPSEDPMTWVVRFGKTAGAAPHIESEEQKYDSLKRQGEKITMLMDDVREADRQFGFSKEYISDAKKAKKMKESGQGDDESMPVFSLHQDIFPQDEDMMADL